MSMSLDAGSMHNKNKNNNNNNKPLTPKSMPPTGDEHANSKPRPPTSNQRVCIRVYARTLGVFVT